MDVILFGASALIFGGLSYFSSPSAARTPTSTKKKRIGIASCKELIRLRQGPTTGSKYGTSGTDEEVLYNALDSKGVAYSVVCWDDASQDWSEFSHMFIRTTWDYSESESRSRQFSAWLSVLQQAGVTIHNDSRVIKWNIHKGYLQDLSSEGFLTIPTEYIYPARDAAPDLKKLVRERGWCSIMMKPCISAGSRGCHRVDGIGSGGGGEDEVATAGAGASSSSSSPSSKLARAQRFLEDMLKLGYDSTQYPDRVPSAAEMLKYNYKPCDMMIQPYIRSIESVGEVSIITIKGKVMHAVRKRPVSGDFRSQEEFGATIIPEALTDAERRHVAELWAAAKVAAAVKAGGSSTPPLPDDALMVVRFDFLRVTPEVKAEVPITPTSPSKCNELLLLEMEAIEPSLFFKCGGSGTAGELADVIKSYA